MSVIALGVNHQTAPVAFRERVAVPAERLPEALSSLAHAPGVREAAILSTCNRTDLYCRTDPSGRSAPVVLDWFRDYHRLAAAEARRHVYLHEASEAVRHVMRVGSGLDSMVLGEPQILGQLKSAYRAAVENGTVGTVLGKLFQHTFAVAKAVRTDTGIGASPVSVAFAAVRLARQIFGDLGSRTALLVGAGETVELAARHLSAQGLGRMVVANRTVENARRVALQFGGYAIGLDEIETHLGEADIVITSTGSPSAVIGVDAVRAALAARRRQPMFMVDIAVPCDIEPEVASLEDVFLYTIDDLRAVVAEGERSRAEAAREAEAIIDDQVARFMSWLGTRAVTDTICAVRSRAESARDETLARALRRLRAGADPEEALAYLAHTLTNKVMHAPTVCLREAGATGRDELVGAARALFRIDASGDDPPS